MLISQALATETATATADATAAAPGAGSGLMGQFLLIGLMFLLFYMLLIRPQQKRLKAQQSMLAALKVFDRPDGPLKPVDTRTQCQRVAETAQS